MSLGPESSLQIKLHDFKVGIHEGTSPCDLSLPLVPWRVYTKGLVAGTCPTNSSHEPFPGTRRRDLSQKFKLVWIRETNRRDQSWSLRLDFEAKMASSHDGTCPRDLLQELVSSCLLTFVMLDGPRTVHELCNENISIAFSARSRPKKRTKTFKKELCCLL